MISLELLKARTFHLKKKNNNTNGSIFFHNLKHDWFLFSYNCHLCLIFQLYFFFFLQERNVVASSFISILSSSVNLLLAVGWLCYRRCPFLSGYTCIQALSLINHCERVVDNPTKPPLHLPAQCKTCSHLERRDPIFRFNHGVRTGLFGPRVVSPHPSHSFDLT